jgi:FkbM family methyltransferase
MQFMDPLRPFWLRAARRAAGKVRGFHYVTTVAAGLLARKGARNAACYGCQFQLDLANYIDELIFWERYEPRTIDSWREAIRAGMVVLDVGANIGLFTLLAAKAGAQVHAFEPNPPTRERLERNLSLNAFASGVRVHPVALSDHSGTATLFDDIRRGEGRYNDGVASLSQANAAGKGTSIDLCTLDEVADQTGIDRVDWIKMDIQGAELPALRGARRVLERNRPRLLLELDGECARSFGWDPTDLVRFLGDISYDLVPLEGQNHLAVPRALTAEPT